MEKTNSIMDSKIKEINLQVPIKPKKFKRKYEKLEQDNKRLEEENKRLKDSIFKSIIREFDNLERKNIKISPGTIKKILEKVFRTGESEDIMDGSIIQNVFSKSKNNKRFFNQTDIDNNEYILEQTEEALEGCFLTLRIRPKLNIDNLEKIIEDLPELLFKTFNQYLNEKKGIKLQICLTGLFYNIQKNEDSEEKSVTSKNDVILNKDNILLVIRKLLREIKNIIDNWDNNEAYFRLINVISVDFKLREYKPLKGSSYIKTPIFVSNTKSVINIKNEDQKCFKYCILLALYENEISKNPQEMYHYRSLERKYPNRLNFEGISFPVKVSDIKKFCNQNQDISINVYIAEENNIIIPYETYSYKERRQHHINLLLLKENENYHYTYIKNISRLLSGQINHHEHKKYICDRCLTFTNTEAELKKHSDLCDYYFENEKAIPSLPSEKEKIISFKNIQKQFDVPLVYYADFESIIKPISDDTSKHELCSYSFFGLGQNEFYKTFEIYTGKNANDTINKFIDSIRNEAVKLDKELHDRLEKFKKPNLNKDENALFENAKNVIFVKYLLMKMILKLGIIVILLANLEVQHINYVI